MCFPSYVLKVAQGFDVRDNDKLEGMALGGLTPAR